MTCTLQNGYAHHTDSSLILYKCKRTLQYAVDHCKPPWGPVALRTGSRGATKLPNCTSKQCSIHAVLSMLAKAINKKQIVHNYFSNMKDSPEFLKILEELAAKSDRFLGRTTTVKHHNLLNNNSAHTMHSATCKGRPTSRQFAATEINRMIQEKVIREATTERRTELCSPLIRTALFSLASTIQKVASKNL